MSTHKEGDSFVVLLEVGTAEAATKWEEWLLQEGAEVLARVTIAGERRRYWLRAAAGAVALLDTVEPKDPAAPASPFLVADGRQERLLHDLEVDTTPEWKNGEHVWKPAQVHFLSQIGTNEEDPGALPPMDFDFDAKG